VSWTAPTTNDDGSPLTELASYRVYYGRSPSCPNWPLREVKSLTSRPASNQTFAFRLTGLIVGELYYIEITAVSSSLAESRCSIAASGRAHSP